MIPSNTDLTDSQNLFLLELFDIQFVRPGVDVELLRKRLGWYNPAEVEGLVELGLVLHEGDQFRLTDRGRGEATRLDQNRSEVNRAAASINASKPDASRPDQTG